MKHYVYKEKNYEVFNSVRFLENDIPPTELASDNGVLVYVDELMNILGKYYLENVYNYTFVSRKEHKKNTIEALMNKLQVDNKEALRLYDEKKLYKKYTDYKLTLMKD